MYLWKTIDGSQEIEACVIKKLCDENESINCNKATTNDPETTKCVFDESTSKCAIKKLCGSGETKKDCKLAVPKDLEKEKCVFEMIQTEPETGECKIKTLCSHINTPSGISFSSATTSN